MYNKEENEMSIINVYITLEILQNMLYNISRRRKVMTFKKVYDNMKAITKAGDIIGVACSGGRDSISLLNYLNSIREDLDIEVVCVNINHSIRDTSERDTRFVAEFCRENRIRCYKFVIDSYNLARTRHLTLEQAAREGRYETFRALIKKGLVDKIALGHHMSDQAETVLMHILRGAGLNGASGMAMTSEGTFIRPMLNVSRAEIDEYIAENALTFVEDETNADSTYTRNFIRNEIFPMLETKFPNCQENLANFGTICKKDDEYIDSLVNLDAVIVENGVVKLPRNYFVYPEPIVNRMIRHAFTSLDVYADIEAKHIEMIKALAKMGENGSKVSLPNKIFAVCEYDYITIFQKKPKTNTQMWAFRSGRIKIDGLGTLIIKRTNDATMREGVLKFDADKLPKGVVWRFRRDGDVFEKFGGGTKKLKSFLVNKKVPARLRDNLPLLATDDEVFVIADVEISEKVRIDMDSKNIYEVTLKKD